MRKYNLRSMFIVALVISLITGLTLASCTVYDELQETGEAEVLTLRVSGSYISLTRPEMIDQAEAIFVGKVTNISPTQWNQDNGEFWEDGSPLHYVEVEVLQPLVDNIGLDQAMTITVWGNSAIGNGTMPDESNIVVAGSPDHDLTLGNQAIFFVDQTEIAWRGTPKPAIRLLGVPSDAYFILEDDGLYHSGRFNEPPLSLGQLIEQIAQRREVIAP